MTAGEVKRAVTGLKTSEFTEEAKADVELSDELEEERGGKLRAAYEEEQVQLLRHFGWDQDDGGGCGGGEDGGGGYDAKPGTYMETFEHPYEAE